MKNVSIQIINILILLSIIELIKNININDISFKEAIKTKKAYDKSDLINNNQIVF